MQVQRTIKRREGVWGIVKGDKGGASQVAPLSPLKKKAKQRIARKHENKTESKATQNLKEMFRFAQHDKIPIVIARR